MRNSHDLRKRLEMCDEQGRVLGVYLPLPERELYQNVMVPATAAELAQSEQEAGRPLEEIFQSIEYTG